MSWYWYLFICWMIGFLGTVLYIGEKRPPWVFAFFFWPFALYCMKRWGREALSKGDPIE